MNQNKKIAIGMVSGLFVLGGISSAMNSKTHHAHTAPQPTTTTFYNAVKSDVDKIKSNVGNGITSTANKVHDKPKLIVKHKPKGCDYNNINSNWNTCTAAQKKANPVPNDPGASHNCSDQAAAMAAAALLSGDLQTAAAAGRLAAKTAGTGQKC